VTNFGVGYGGCTKQCKSFNNAHICKNKNNFSSMQFIIEPTTNPLFKQVGRGKAFRRAKGSMETYKGMKGQQEEKPLL
jgi:hypothetical protein